MAKESYDELIFQLGDLAREHLADAKNVPRAMEAVFAAEDDVLARRTEMEGFEDEMNQEDAAWQDFLEQQEVEKGELKAVINKWRGAVIGVESRSRDMKKKLSSLKAAFRYQKDSLKRAEISHKEMEIREGHDVKKINLSRENLKKSRLHIMREQRNLEELEWELNQVLTPRPGQQGAQGILAHKSVLEMEDERQVRHGVSHRVREGALSGNQFVGPFHLCYTNGRADIGHAVVIAYDVVPVLLVAG
jgi:chromosome segregation ATPase